ncbi:MAG: tetratricopeptide repeat protein [Myxococcaceae bacterium]
MARSPFDALLEAGELDKARTKATAALKKDPADRSALLALAKITIMDGDFAAAEPLLAKAEAKGEDTASRLVKAALLSQRGKQDAAKKQYQAVLASEPSSAEAHYGLGYLLASEGDFAAALPALQKAVELKGNVASFHFHLARVLIELEDPKAAVVHLEKATELNPAYPPVYLVWASLAQALGDLDGAIGVLEEGLKVVPGDGQMLTGMSNLLVAKGDLARAGALAEQVLEQHPNDPAALSNVARFLMAQKRFDDALQICRALNERDESTPTSKGVEAMVLECMDPPDLPGAIAAYEAAADLDPDNWEPANNLGNLLMRTGSDKELGRAIEALEEARRRAPDEPAPKLNLALAYARKKDKARSKALAAELVKGALPKADPIRVEAERLLKTLG